MPGAGGNSEGRAIGGGRVPSSPTRTAEIQHKGV